LLSSSSSLTHRLTRCRSVWCEVGAELTVLGCDGEEDYFFCVGKGEEEFIISLTSLNLHRSKAKRDVSLTTYTHYLLRLLFRSKYNTFQLDWIEANREVCWKRSINVLASCSLGSASA
jgi:hypothetical protein